LGSCYDENWGLTSQGALVQSRAAGDLAIFSSQHPGVAVPSNAPACKIFDWWHCHLGTRIVGTATASPTPTGEGGSIVPGAYRLTSISSDNGTDPDLLIGVGVTQTLYFSGATLLFESDDDHRFSYTGSYTYSLDGSSLVMAPTCESQPAQYRQWSLELGYTASGTDLWLYSKALSYSAHFELVTR
jgi:hypothetical protein